MYEIGSMIVYGTEGVCSLSDITEKQVGDEVHTYYVLEPVHHRNSTVLVPMDNHQLATKIRSIPNKREAEAALRGTSSPGEWIVDDSQRRDFCKTTLAYGSFEQLASLVNVLGSRQNELEQQGKRLHASDLRYLKAAEKLLSEELAVVYGGEPEESLPRVMASIRS